jgi:hypothetical protein
MMNDVELANRFAYHRPKSEEIAKTHAAVREMCLEVAEDFNHILPDSREKSLAMTHLEEAMMWANAAIARHQSAE